EPLPGNTGGDFGLREPVHETTTDSRTGEDEGVSRQASHGRRHLRHRERNSLVKNRMRETCTSGSVRGGDGNIPTYSALDAPQWGDEALERVLVGEPGMRVEERQLAGVVRIGEHRQHLAAE